MEPVPAADAPASAAPPVEPTGPVQLDLFSWRQKPAAPPPKGQISLFPDDPAK